MKKRVKSLIYFTMMLSVVLLLSGCAERTKNDVETTSNESHSGKTIETTGLMGQYTLEECKERTESQKMGIYIAYDDGSFDRYYGGGYCRGLTSSSTAFYGMFLDNSIANYIPEIKTTDKLVVFSEANFMLDVYPISSMVNAIEVDTSDGSGYGLITSQNENALWISVCYTNGEDEDWKILYIDGESSAQYQTEVVERKINPYKGMPNTVCTVTSYGFKNTETVTLGVAEGTKLVETTYKVNAKYYDCYPEHSDWEVEDYYQLVCTPTPDGYATIDMVDVFGDDVPSGEYVILLRGNGGYIATLLKWNNG